MVINDIFERNVQRPIEGVIKADDSEHLATEVDEYVLTNEAAKELTKLLEEYTNYTNANGVWISGFFGSGKSHLLKMLAHLLGEVEGQEFPRGLVSDAFQEKTDDKFLAALIKKADKIPGKSLLFNIDQKAAIITKDQTDALLKVFVKIFDESRGYFGNQGHVARFERDLDDAGHYVDFQAAFLRITGKSWKDERKNYIVQGANVDRAYAEVIGDDAPKDILKQYNADYSVSIDDFAGEVADWLERQPDGFRLNFFVDEVGQFIGDDTRLMLNLQTIAESLNTKAKGRSWVFVTSQEDMDKIIGDQTRRQAQDFSKIQARFATRVKLSSQDVEEVIRKRLLEKSSHGAEAIRPIYAAEYANFRTLFGFADGGTDYKIYPTEDLFIGTYPFVTYQFPLFQQAIEGLSNHNAFEGKHASVGERSMLGVVQEVTKQLGQYEIGNVASFDRMFEGIRSALKGAPQRQVQLAEQHLGDDLAARLVKALFLVKYVESFKATARNLTVLVYDRFGLDLPELQERVRQSLALLEQQTYVQRTGDVYSYLTNEEQDIEKEIKSVEVDGSEISDYLFKNLLLANIMKGAGKFRYTKTNQDFPIGYMLDDVAKGQARDLTLHFISAADADQIDNVRLQGAGKPELRVLMGSDPRLIADVINVLKTSKYVKQKQGTAISDSVKRILESKLQDLGSREKELSERAKEDVARARLFHNAEELKSNASSAEARIADGMNVLIAKTYPQLDLLGGKVYPESDIATFATAEDEGLPGVAAPLSLAADEMFKVGIQARENLGEHVTVKKIVSQFETRPYGWDFGSILCTVAHLFAQGRIVVELDNVTLKRSEIAKELRNTQKHQSIVIRKQATFDGVKVKAFSDFIKDFFDEASPPKDALELAHHGAERLANRLIEVRALVNGSRYPFTDSLRPLIEMLDEVVGKPPSWYVTEFTGGDALVEAKNDFLVPIEQFINGPQANIYDNARTFLDAARGNLAYLPEGAAESVDSLLSDPQVFRGNKVNQLKAAIDHLAVQVDELLRNERAQAVDAIMRGREDLVESRFFQEATSEAQQQVKAVIEEHLNKVLAQVSVAEIRLAPVTFSGSVLPSLLAALAAEGVAQGDVLGRSDGDSPAGSRSGVAGKAAPLPVASPQRRFVPIGEVAEVGGKQVLETSDDVDEYVQALRVALLEVISVGKCVVR